VHVVRTLGQVGRLQGAALARGLADEVSNRPTRMRLNASSTSGLVLNAVRTWNSSAPGSNSRIEPPSVRESPTAFVTIVDSTSSRSRLELTASPTAPSASSWSTLRPSSPPRSSSALTRPAVWTAIAAWAAKLLSSSTARSLNGSTWLRHTDRTPTASSPTSMGAPRMDR
jgi:hypothetical protein